MTKTIVVGAGSMGAPLVKCLQSEGHEVVGVVTRKPHALSGVPWIEAPEPDEITAKLDLHTLGVEVAFLATPSGSHETPYIDYFIRRQIYDILFCKHDLATRYKELKPNRHMIGASATVGARTMSLPLLRMQHLQRKKFVLYAYLNASINFFMHGAAGNKSAVDMFEKAKLAKLAEPGSTDVVSFVNTEIGSDYRYKLSIAMNDAILPDGLYMSPDIFEPYVPLSMDDILSLTLPSRNERYVVRIDNIGLKPDVKAGDPGTLFAKCGEFTVCGGFHDMSRQNHLSNWVKDGETNGVMIRFEGANSYEGTVEMAGLGAGKATVAAAMNDFYEYELARDGMLSEARWPRRFKLSAGQRVE